MAARKRWFVAIIVLYLVGLQIPISFTGNRHVALGVYAALSIVCWAATSRLFRCPGCRKPLPNLGVRCCPGCGMAFEAPAPAVADEVGPVQLRHLRSYRRAARGLALAGVGVVAVAIGAIFREMPFNAYFAALLVGLGLMVSSHYPYQRANQCPYCRSMMGEPLWWRAYFCASCGADLRQLYSIG